MDCRWNFVVERNEQSIRELLYDLNRDQSLVLSCGLYRDCFHP